MVLPGSCLHCCPWAAREREAVRNCQFLCRWFSLGWLGVLLGQEMLYHLPPGSQLVLGPSCSARTQRTQGWGVGGGLQPRPPPREEAVALWGNPSVAVGHIAAGMETETRGFQLGGVCLKSANTGFRLSPTLTLVIR